MSQLDNFVSGDYSELIIKELNENRYSDLPNIWNNPNNIYNLLNNAPTKTICKILEYLSEANYDFSLMINIDNKEIMLLEALIDKVPHINSEIIFNTKTGENIAKDADSKIFTYNLIEKAIKGNRPDILRGLHKEWWLISKMDIFSKLDGDDVQIRDKIYQQIIEHKTCIKEFCEITYSDYGELAFKIFEKALNDNLDLKEIEHIIRDENNLLSDKWKETFIAGSLIGQKNLKLTKRLIAHFFNKELSDYKPNHIPIWTYIDHHKSSNIYKNLLSNKVSPFDYNPNTTDSFIGNLLAYSRKNEKTLRELGVDEEKIIKNILKPSKFENEDGSNINHYSLLASSFNKDIAEFLRLTEKKIELIFPEISKDNCKNKNGRKEELEKVLEKTYFSKPFINSENDYSKYFSEKKYVISCILNADYKPTKGYKIIDEHIGLLIETGDTSQQEKYLNILFNFSRDYGFSNINSESPTAITVTKMLNYVRGFDSELWLKIHSKIIEAPGDFESQYSSDFSKEVRTELKKISYEYSLCNTKENKTESKRIKI